MIRQLTRILLAHVLCGPTMLITIAAHMMSFDAE